MVSSPEETRVLPVGFLVEREVEPVGRWFLTQWDRIHSTRKITENLMEDSSDDEGVDEIEDEFEDDLEYLRSLDPKEVKEQDHYRVLGITKLRINATDDQIKRAHRQKVLRHHPDKRKAAGEEIKLDDDYFPCITKAFEILGNPVKRRSFDSVDPEFDDDIPDILKNKERDFFKIFGPALANNARWSNKTPVPLLGDIDSSREYVDDFYNFWFDFDSWREYSYLDEEDKEKASDKWERKEMERINKAQRLEKKKEEGKRMKKLVDNAFNSDPRIAKFRKADLDEKAAKKKARADAIQAKKDEEERIKREAEEKIKREEEEKEKAEKEKKAAAKLEKEAAKKIKSSERKKLRTLSKEANMFALDEDERLANLLDIEKMCETYTTEQLIDLNNQLANSEDQRETFLTELEAMCKRNNTEMRKFVSKKDPTVAKVKASSIEWSADELQLLIKAVKTFPAGTKQRWEVVTEYINQHTKTPEIERKAKETLSMAKEMQSGNFAMSSLKDEVNKMAYENTMKAQKRDTTVQEAATDRTDTPAQMAGINPEPWAPEEQKVLEQALKTYPSSTPERWDRIAETLPGRSKKDCMKRYKELAELVKAKKAAALAAANKKS